MAGSCSPCGACKFLRRKCVKGCVFAPYFCHEQGAQHFGAIHKVFGASNFSRLLSHIPVSERSEAAFTIAYEAQARLQDPIYGCVSHIFTLQQQVANLQAQLAYLKDQAAKIFDYNNYYNYGMTNPSESFYGEHPNQQESDNWILQSENSNMVMPRFGYDFTYNSSIRDENSMMFLKSLDGGYENFFIPEETISFPCFEEGSSSSNDMQRGNWTLQDADDLQSVAFGYISHSL